MHSSQSWEKKTVRLVTGDTAMTRHRTNIRVCARLCVLFTCRIGIFLKKCSCTMWLKLIRPRDISQQQSLNSRWTNHFTSAERRWWDRVILALVWSVCSTAPVFRCPIENWVLPSHAHMSTCSCLSFFFLSFWGLISFGFAPPPHLHSHIQHISATLCLSRAITEDTCSCSMYFYIFIPILFPFPCTRAQHLFVKLPFDICALLGISCSSDHLTWDQEQLFSFCLSDTWCPTLMTSCVACC